MAPRSRCGAAEPIGRAALQGGVRSRHDPAGLPALPGFRPSRGAAAALQPQRPDSGARLPEPPDPLAGH